jgi:CBS domain-containing protein
MKNNSDIILCLVKVKYAMRSPPITASPSETILSIAQKMISNNIGAIVVVKEKKPLGIITERDLIKGILTLYDKSLKVRAKEIMSSPVFNIKAEKTVGEAFKIMKKKDIRRLCVMEKDEFVGIVTERRLLDVIRKTMRKLADSI